MMEGDQMKTYQRSYFRSLYTLVVAVLLTGILVSAFISASDQGAEQVIAFKHVNLLPMTSETVIEDQTVLVKGSKIVDIGPSDTMKIPRGAQVIDGKGAYLMPGLADMHIHTRPDWDNPNVWPVNPLSLYLANGVTSIRDMGPHGNPPYTYTLRWRDEILSGSLIRPAIYTSGTMLAVSPLDNPAGLVQQNHDQGFDFLKILCYLSPEDFQAVMEAAREQNMYTAGHIPYAVGLDGMLWAHPLCCGVGWSAD
jgi:hypothetical protein